MQYSKILIAASAAHAAAQAVDVVTDLVTDVVATVVVTQTAGQAAPTDVVAQAADTDSVTAAAVDTAAAAPSGYSYGSGHGHGHGHFHSSSAAAAASVTTIAAAPPASTPAYVAPTTVAAPSSAPAVAASSSAAAAPSSAPATGSGSSSSGGCPADTSGQYLSPGVNGAPSKSMLDSINYIRRLYNSNANCLTWSPSLASASQTCAADSSESHLRVNSDIVSAPGYETSSYYSGDLASSQFERSMFWMLCQSPGDSQLAGTCSGKTGEAGCSAGACTGHHDAIVDAPNTNKFMGCGSSSATTWLSCSFSATQDPPAGYSK